MRLFSICLVMTLVGTGCATPLKNRAETLWSARVKGDCSTVHAYQDPRTVEAKQRDDFIKWCSDQAPFMYQSYEIQDAETEKDWGWVDVRYSSKIRNFPNQPAREVQTWEKWWRVDKNWYPVPPKQLDEVPEAPSKRQTTEEARLKARFDASWNARKNGEWETLYKLLDPRDTATIPLKEYSEGEALFEFLSADVRWTQVIGDRGRVLVFYMAKPREIRNLDPQEFKRFEDWVNVDGEWYRDVKVESKPAEGATGTTMLPPPG